MLEVFNTRADPAARETAYWYPVKGDLAKSKILKVQDLGIGDHNYAVVSGENLQASANMAYIRTRYDYPYEVKQNIFFHKKWYEITGIKNERLPALGLYPRQEYTISMIEVMYGNGYEREETPLDEEDAT